MANVKLAAGKPETDNPIHFWTEAVGGEVYLKASDKSGATWYVLYIRPDGQIERCTSVDPVGAPFKFDSLGRIIID